MNSATAAAAWRRLRRGWLDLRFEYLRGAIGQPVRERRWTEASLVARAAESIRVDLSDRALEITLQARAAPHEAATRRPPSS